MGQGVDMGIMKEIDILRQEGAREPEDFEAHGYGRKEAEGMSEVVKAAEPFERRKCPPTCGSCENPVATGIEYCVECLTAMIGEQIEND